MPGTFHATVMERSYNRAVQSDCHIGDVKVKEENY